MSPLRSLRARGLLAAVLVLALAPVAACKGSDGAGGAPAAGAKRGPVAFPVEAATAVSRRVEYAVNAVGSVAAFEEVQVTSRVSGAIEKVRFTEGQKVKTGDVLVEIEPARFRLAVEAARATLAKAKASQADAQAGLARRERAVAESPGLIPGEEIETWRTKVSTASAEAAQVKVTLDQAELNLRDAYVRALSGGTIQTRTVQTGQYVQPGAVLATLVNREPLLLRFEIPESDAARVRPTMDLKFRVRGEETQYQARITHVADMARETSRMVPVTAQIDDPRKDVLRPGSFTEIQIPVGASDQAVVVPQTAVRPSERGFLAFVVEKGADAPSGAGKSVARERVLSLGMRTADGLVEVRAGLTAGERLVVRGAEALRDGVEVKVAK